MHYWCFPWTQVSYYYFTLQCTFRLVSTGTYLSRFVPTCPDLPRPVVYGVMPVYEHCIFIDRTVYWTFFTAGLLKVSWKKIELSKIKSTLPNNKVIDIKIGFFQKLDHCDVWFALIDSFFPISWFEKVNFYNLNSHWWQFNCTL